MFDARSGIRLIRHVVFLCRHCGGVVLCCHERTLAVADIRSVLIPMTNSCIPLAFSRLSYSRVAPWHGLNVLRRNQRREWGRLKTTRFPRR